MGVWKQAYSFLILVPWVLDLDGELCSAKSLWDLYSQPEWSACVFDASCRQERQINGIRKCLVERWLVSMVLLKVTIRTQCNQIIGHI